jgi:hypothetical protein
MTAELSHSLASLIDVVKVLLCIWTVLAVLGALLRDESP